MSPSKTPKKKNAAKGGGKVKVRVEKDVTGAEEISDEELDGVAGGTAVTTNPNPVPLPPNPLQKPKIRME